MFSITFAASRFCSIKYTGQSNHVGVWYLVSGVLCTIIIFFNSRVFSKVYRKATPLFVQEQFIPQLFIVLAKYYEKCVQYNNEVLNKFVSRG